MNTIQKLSQKSYKLIVIPIFLVLISVAALGYIFFFAETEVQEEIVTELPETGGILELSLEANKQDVQAHTSTGCTNQITYTITANNIVPCEQPPLNAILAFDRTGSMDDDGGDPPQPLTDAKSAAIGFVDQLDPSLDSVGLVSFSVRDQNPLHATLESGLTNDFNFVSDRINALYAEGYTDIGYPLLLSANEAVTSDPSATIILLTDGVPNESADPGMTPEEYAVYQANQAKNSGVRIITIGLGTQVDNAFLRDQISSGGPTDHYSAPDSSDLSDIYLSIVDDLRNQRYPSTDTRLDVDLATYIPNDVSVVSAEGATIEENVISWEIEDFLCEDTLTRTFTIETTPTIVDERIITLQVEAIDEEDDLEVSNEVSATVHAPVLQIDYTTEPESPSPGSNLTYEITVSNSGSGIAYGLQAVDSFSSQYTVNETTITENGILNAQNIMWENNDSGYQLNPNNTITFGFSGTVSTNLQGELENTFQLSSLNGCYSEQVTISSSTQQEEPEPIEPTPSDPGETTPTDTSPDDNLPQTGDSAVMLVALLGVILVFMSLCMSSTLAKNKQSLST